MAEPITFKRVRSGVYRDESFGWSIERQGPARVARGTRVDWHVKDAAGEVQRVRQTLDEARDAARSALGATGTGSNADGAQLDACTCRTDAGGLRHPKEPPEGATRPTRAWPVGFTSPVDTLQSGR